MILGDRAPSLERDSAEVVAAYWKLDGAAFNLRTFETQVRTAVRYARGAGMSWGSIGKLLHVSKQAAQQRYGHLAPLDASDLVKWAEPSPSEPSSGLDEGDAS